MSTPRSASGSASRPSGSTSFQSVAGPQGVPLVHVAVQQHRPLRVVRGGPLGRVGQRHLDRPLRAGPAEPVPGRLDVRGQPGRLLRPGRQAAVRGRPPQPHRDPAEDLVPLLDRQARSGTSTGRAAPAASRRTPRRAAAAGRSPRRPASRRTVISSAACRPWPRRISSLSTAGVPSASVGRRRRTPRSRPGTPGRPSIRQSRSSRPTRSGSPASQSSAPAARANARTVSGTSTLATGPSHRAGPARFQSRSASSPAARAAPSPGTGR